MSNQDQYYQFVTYQTAVNFDVIDKDLEYDTAWAQAGVLYDKFLDSPSNVDSKSEYDCIVDFMYEVKAEIKMDEKLRTIRAREGNRKIVVEVTRTYHKEARVEIELPRSMTQNEVAMFINTDVELNDKIENAIHETSLDWDGNDQLDYTDTAFD